MNDIGLIFTDILQLITSRYVVSGTAIPAYVLKLKDEAMSIFEKSKGKTNAAVSEQYERRLGEIKETLERGEIK